MKSLLICFESYQGSPYSDRQGRKSMVNTLLMVKLPLYVRDSLEDKAMLFTHIILSKEKIETYFVSPASREYFVIEPTAFLSTN